MTWRDRIGLALLVTVAGVVLLALCLWGSLLFDVVVPPAVFLGGRAVLRKRRHAASMRRKEA